MRKVFKILQLSFYLTRTQIENLHRVNEIRLMFFNVNERTIAHQ